MLDRLEVYDFKSYKGHHTLGPFKVFTCVIGPNGAGKSNLFDAISFVLGVRSAQLRSSQLKDLIYRGGKKRASDPNGEDLMDVDGQEDEDSDAEVEAGPSSRKAWVMAVYIDRHGQEFRYQRIITSSGSSEYKLNGKTVTYAKYDESLQRHNILVKARNFLVFQGDVEMVAQQDPKTLTNLIEQISGSLELKEDYEEAKAAHTKSAELLQIDYTKRKGINSEIKQWKEQREEVKRFEKLRGERDDAVILEILYKLYHIEQGLEEKRGLVEDKNEAVRALRAEQDTHDASMKMARKNQVKAQKDVSKHEKNAKGKQKELDDRRPDLLAVETQIAHTAKKLKAFQQKQTAVQRDRAERAASLKTLQKNLADTEKAVNELEAEHRRASKARGLALSEDDLADYRRLRTQATAKALDERATVETGGREAQKLRDVIAGLDDKLEQSRYKRQKRAGEEAEYAERVRTYEAKVTQLDADYGQAKRDLNAAQQERTQFVQKQAELDDKLRDIVTKLLQLNADQRENEREVRLKEAIEVLKRTIPGVHGRISDICRASQNKYNTAVATVFGRNLDSVVVDTEEIALQCIQAMRDQRSGSATFIPLDTIQVKPIEDKYRNFQRARLAVDVITFNTKLEKAVHYVCGSTIICDDLATARSICFEGGNEVKAVTLEGGVIHKSGQMSGGSASSSRVLGSNEAEGLRKHEENLRSRLADHVKTRPRNDREDQLQRNITRIEAELSLARDDLSASRTRLQSCADEVRHLDKEIAKLEASHEKSVSELEAVQTQIDTAQASIDDEESSIFDDFCRRIGVDTIREYEEKQHRFTEEEGSAKLKADKTLAKLRHQTAFETEQLQGFDDQLAKLGQSITTNQDAVDKLGSEKALVEEDIGNLEAETIALDEQQTALEEALVDANNQVERVRKTASKGTAAFQKAQKEISTWNDEISSLAAERFAIFRRCRLEEISLPISGGSLANVPLEEPGNDDMDVETEQVTQQPAAVTDYELEVDYDLLDDDDRQEDTAERQQELAETVRKLSADLQRMAPNMKAVEKLGEVEAKLKATNKDHESARQQTKDAKERFEALRDQRMDLFTTAFNHISERIDQVYKDLTKGKQAPMGGTAYLSLEEDDEPYLHGVKYHAMPPMKRFRDMEQLSGGEKTMAALALLFAIHSFKPSPFFVLDEVDAALDNTNVARIASYIRSRASESFQFIVISLKTTFYDKSGGLLGVWRNVEKGSSDTLTLDLEQY